MSANSAFRRTWFSSHCVLFRCVLCMSVAFLAQEDAEVQRHKWRFLVHSNHMRKSRSMAPVQMCLHCALCCLLPVIQKRDVQKRALTGFLLLCVKQSDRINHGFYIFLAGEVSFRVIKCLVWSVCLSVLCLFRDMAWIYFFATVLLSTVTGIVVSEDSRAGLLRGASTVRNPSGDRDEVTFSTLAVDGRL